MCTHQDIQEFDEQIKELLDKRLIQNSKSPYTSPAFMVRNHGEKKRGKARLVINYKKINYNTVFDDYYISNKTVLFLQSSRSLLVLKNELQEWILTSQNG